VSPLTVADLPLALQIIDMRDQLPLVPAEEVGRAAKSSITVHWNGPPIPPGEDPLDVIKSDAWFHTSKDWSPEPGIQGGDGIMYHFLVAPDGRCFKTRDDDAVLWHCGSQIGNWFSYAVQVMVGGNGDGTGDPVTSQQYAALTQLIAHLALDDVKPHKIWSGTACPGIELTAWINRQGWKEEDMNAKEVLALIEETYGLTNTTQAIKDVLKEQNAAIVKLANDETVADTEVAALKDRIDKLHTI